MQARSIQFKKTKNKRNKSLCDSSQLFSYFSFFSSLPTLLHKSTQTTHLHLCKKKNFFLLLLLLMDAKLLLHHHRGLPALRIGRNMTQKVRNPPVIVAVVAKPKDNVGAAMEGILTETKMTVYKDNWFDRIAINHLSQSIQATTGIRNEKEGYDSLIEAAAAVSLNFNPIQQQELVLQSLQKAFPKPILSLIRTLLPNSKFTREYFATFTTIFFSWLVGPCEVKESEQQGKIEKNVVHIKKCRFLEGTNCVGMCTNLCKMPSQRFIKDSFGIPVSMVPNFEDMSCDMIYGQHPPAASDDPALKQPCYKILCKAKQKHSVDCSSL